MISLLVGQYLLVIRSSAISPEICAGTSAGTNGCGVRFCAAPISRMTECLRSSQMLQLAVPVALFCTTTWVVVTLMIENEPLSLST